LELARVTDEDQSPALRHGEGCELTESAGPDHAGLVNDDRRCGREPPSIAGSGLAPLVEELGEVSDGMPVSSWRTLAAFAVGATPNTGRPVRLRSSAAARSVVVFPVPAGPTTRTRRS
jgi:hypothetical protein